MIQSSIQFTLLNEMRMAIVSLILTNNRIAEQAGLHTTDMQLLQLIETNTDVTPKMLSDITGITTGGITVVLDRLEKKNLIARRAHPTDRRRVIVVLGPLKERKKLQDAYADITKDTFEMMSRYSDKELAVIADFFSNIKNIK